MHYGAFPKAPSHVFYEKKEKKKSIIQATYAQYLSLSSASTNPKARGVSSHLQGDALYHYHFPPGVCYLFLQPSSVVPIHSPHLCQITALLPSLQETVLL